MRIVIDGMGGDNAPDVIVKGAMDALPALDGAHSIIITGREELIDKSLRKYGYAGGRISVVDAGEIIANDEPPVKAIRTKKDSSIVKGLEMVKRGEGDVFISAGSTGALLAGGLFILGRIQGIDRPTLATVYPVIGMEPSLLTDAGANAECKPNNLLEFATMGAIYMQKVMGRRDPSVGLVNNGTEEGKGTTLTRAAFALLEKSRLHFVGNIEAREIPNGACDVIVTDGFTGNAILKMTEGMGLMFMREMKRRFLSGIKSRLGAALLRKQLLGVRRDFNYAEYGGAPILGVKGALLKMHGSSDQLAVSKTIIKAVPYVEGRVVDIIQNSVCEIEQILAE